MPNMGTAAPGARTNLAADDSGLQRGMNGAEASWNGGHPLENVERVKGEPKQRKRGKGAQQPSIFSHSRSISRPDCNNCVADRQDSSLVASMRPSDLSG